MAAMKKHLNAVLRIAQEPCEYFDNLRVHELLTCDPQGYLNYICSQLADIAAGRASLELPHKQVFSDGRNEGDFRLMPCVLRNGERVHKTVKLVGTNLAQREVPGQITVGKAFALHPEENFITHAFDACLLSSARTGVCAALALGWLAPCAGRLGVFGAGKVGYYVAFYALASGATKDVVLYDTDSAQAARTAMVLAEEFPDARIVAEQQPPRRCDTLVLATTSTSPLCAPDSCDAKLVISLGADSEDQHELHPSWVGAADLYTDTMDSLHFGDLLAWQSAGLVAEKDVADLFCILRDGPQAGSRRRLFISTGSALFDNLTIGYLLTGNEDVK